MQKKRPHKYQKRFSLYGVSIDQVIDTVLKYRPKDKRKKKRKAA